MQKPSLNNDLAVSKLQRNLIKVGEAPVDMSNQPLASVGKVSFESDNGGTVSDATSSLDSSNSRTLTATISLQPRQPSNYYYKPDSVKSSDSEFLSDDLSPPLKHKMVAIDTSQNKQFSQKLLPVQSPEFDNVMDQVSKKKRDCEMFR